MSVAAGVDIGNSTTEVLLAEVERDRVAVIGSASAPTRRRKGSPESVAGAVALVRRLERQHGVRVEVAAAAPLRPVETSSLALPESERATGRLRLVTAGSGTVGGEGAGVGAPVIVDPRGAPEDRSGPVVAVVPPDVGYLRVLGPLRALAEQGRLAAVVVTDDEAVLIANRLQGRVPVVDEVPPDTVVGAERVAVEVRPSGAPLRELGDPLYLMASLGLGESERVDAAALAAQLRDRSNAVVAVDRAAAEHSAAPSAWFDIGSSGRARRLCLATESEILRTSPVGAAQAYGLPPALTRREVDDLFTVDLASVADTVVARTGSERSRAVVLAVLHADEPYVDPAGALTEQLGVPVGMVPSEGRAARVGGLTTPGADPAALVVDVGGGTVDVVGPADEVVAAGAGELLTAAVSALTGVTPASAEWIKRGPAVRVETPQLLLGEDGSREFLAGPTGCESVGKLAVRGPAGLLPFASPYAPGEWRALRLRLKADALGGNIARALRTLGATPQTVVLVGGPVGDDEVLAAVSRAMPPQVAVGRGNAGGALGHRFVVAYGLLLSLSAPEG